MYEPNFLSNSRFFLDFWSMERDSKILTYITFISVTKLNAASTMPNFQPEAANFPAPSR